MKNSLYVMMFIVLSSTSFAQVKTVPSKTPAVKPPVAATVTHYDLESQHQKAVLDQKNLDTERNFLVDHYNSCASEILDAKLKYNEWFLSHTDDFKKSIPDVSVLNEKIARIKNAEVLVNPVENNLTDTVSISLQKLADFIKINNSRVKECSNDAEQLRLVEKHMHNPAKNPLHIASEQLPKALDLFNPFLNQKQSETFLDYKLNLIKTDCKLSLAIEIYQIQKASAETLIYQETLIDESGTLHFDFKAESESAWKFYTQNSISVAENAIDGFSRYFDFLKEIPATCLPDKKALDFSLLEYADTINSGAYITYDEWVLAYKKLILKAQNHEAATAVNASRHGHGINKGPYAMEFAFIPASKSKFTMGSGAPPGSETPTTSTQSMSSDETPHTVILTHGFEMQTTDVTQKQYADAMGSNPSSNKSSTSNPVEQVTWYDANTFANKASIAANLKPCYDDSGKVILQNGMTEAQSFYNCKGYRLPTEAEWEYAARAGTTTAFFFGNDEKDMKDYGWTYENSGNTSHEVAKLKPNAFGLYDMVGNVWQWVQDSRDGSSAYPTSDKTDPLSAVGSGRALRGGAWSNYARYARSASRGYYSPGGSFSFVGFRLVRTVR